MLHKILLKIINLNLVANPQVMQELRKSASKIITINLAGIRLTCLIAPDGQLEHEQAEADCIINIPLMSASHLLHQDELKTYHSLNIKGDIGLANRFLVAIGQINPSNVLYNHNSQVLGMAAVILEKFIRQLIDYAGLVSQNATFSISQYLQYDAEIISDKFSLDNFRAEVATLQAQSQILANRVVKLMEQA